MTGARSPEIEPLPTKGDIVAIVQEGVFRRQPPEEPFQIKSGSSWIYCDVKYGVRLGEDLSSVGRYAAAQLQAEKLGFAAVGGLTMGATPFASAIAMALRDRRWFEVCKPDDP